jgi:site-specific DNA-adenine methylase
MVDRPDEDASAAEIARWMEEDFGEARKQDLNRGEAVRIREGDFEKVLQQHEGEDTLVYADPPYVDTEQAYEGTFTKEDHQRLINVLNEFESDWILSYGSEPPEDLETEYIQGREVKRSPGHRQQANGGEEWLITNILPERIGTFETVREQKPADEW